MERDNEKEKGGWKMKKIKIKMSKKSVEELLDLEEELKLEKPETRKERRKKHSKEVEAYFG